MIVKTYHNGISVKRQQILAFLFLFIFGVFTLTSASFVKQTLLCDQGDSCTYQYDEVVNIPDQNRLIDQAQRWSKVPLAKQKRPFSGFLLIGVFIASLNDISYPQLRDDFSCIHALLRFHDGFWRFCFSMSPQAP